MKNVEKAQKSQVLHLPECFSRQSKKYIAFKKSILPSKKVYFLQKYSSLQKYMYINESTSICEK